MITIVLLRAKGAEDAGIYGLAYAYTNMFVVISTFGMDNYQLSDVRGRHSDGTYIAARFSTSLVSVICFSIILFFFTDFSLKVRLCCAALMLYRILEGISGVYICILQKMDDYKTIGISRCIKSIFVFGIFCAALYLFELNWAVICMSAAFLLVAVLIDFPQVTKRAAFTAKTVKHDIINILKPSFILVAQGFIGNFAMFFPRYIIEKTYSIEELGYFSSITLIMLIFPILVSPVLSVFIPGISGLYIDKQYYIIKRMIFRMGLCVIAGTILLCLSSLVWGRFALSLVFGEKILPYGYLLIPVLLTSGVILGCGVLGSVLTAMQKRMECFIATIAAVLVVALSCPALVSAFYMNGSLYSLIIAYAVQGLIMLAYIFYHLRNKAAVTDNREG
jgi:O-antigen/teichoic acid export membrane protein